MSGGFRVHYAHRLIGVLGDTARFSFQSEFFRVTKNKVRFDLSILTVVASLSCGRQKGALVNKIDLS